METLEWGKTKKTCYFFKKKLQNKTTGNLNKKYKKKKT